MSARRWLLHLEGLPPGPNARLHWSERYRLAQQWKTAAYLLARSHRIPRVERLRLSIVVYRRRLGTADPDNDWARVKPAVDGIVAAGVVPSDTYRYVEIGGVREERGPEGLLLILEEIPQEPRNRAVRASAGSRRTKRGSQS